MEDRINSIEKEVAMMAKTQESMAKALEDISETMKAQQSIHSDIAVMRQRLLSLDDNLKESFDRVYARIEKVENNVTWFWRTFIGSVFAGLIGYLVHLS